MERRAICTLREIHPDANQALIARNLWEMQQYYEVVISEDDGVQKAMEILCNDKEYKKLLK